MARAVCPNCGADLPKKAKACPECGSDDQTGWSEEAGTGGLDLPGEDFDYDEFVQEEFGNKNTMKDIKPRGVHWVWWLTGVALLAGIAYMVFGRFF